MGSWQFSVSSRQSTVYSIVRDKFISDYCILPTVNFSHLPTAYCKLLT